MRICQDHWAKMRKAVEDADLGGLIVKGAEEAHAKMTAQLEGQPAIDGFEPLLNANFAILGAFLNDAGIQALGFEGCPLCEVDAANGGAQNWIDGAVKDQHDIWQRLKTQVN